MKRILSLAFVIVMIVALVGCGSNKREPIKLTLSTEDSEAILKAAGVTLPDKSEAAGAESTVKWFCWGDPFQNYSDDEIVNTGFWTFTEKYGCSLDYIETTYFDAADDLAAAVVSGTPPDVMTGGVNSTASFPMRAIQGTIQPIDPWISYDDPLWAPMKGLAEKFAIGGKHYQICIETTPANVVPYNRRVIEEYGYDDPAELYYNDEWTWEKFYDMCVDFSEPDEDRFALDGYAFEGMFVESTGQQILMNDENGRYYSNLDSPEIERGQDYLYNLLKNDCLYGRGGWSLRSGSGDNWGAGVKDGLCLFYVIGETFFENTVELVSANWGDIANGELMFAPLPRDENGDGIYYCSSSFDNIKGAMVIINDARNPEGAALLASCIRFKVIDPVVQQIDERQMREKYLWNDDMIEMSKECQRIADANFIIDYSGNLPDGLQTVYGNLARSIVRSGQNASSWAQLKEANRESFEYYIEELNNMIEEFDS